MITSPQSPYAGGLSGLTIFSCIRRPKSRALLLIRFGCTVAVVSVPMEQVHEWTGKQQQVRENSEQVSPMFCEQEEKRYRKKANQDPLGPAAHLVLSFGLIRLIHGIPFARGTGSRIYNLVYGVSDVKRALAKGNVGFGMGTGAYVAINSAMSP